MLAARPCAVALRFRILSLSLGCLVLGLMPAVSQGAEALKILPPDVLLVGSQARQHFVVELERDGRLAGPAPDAKWESSDPKIVKIEGGLLVPVANGNATLRAWAGDRKVSAEVRVVDMDKPFEWSFRNHVQSVLTKAGCNMGACHGAQAGKKGFRLSLRGYDAEGDYNVLTRQARGRRVVPSDPGRSLMLTKPTGVLPHGGGLRFEAGSLEYRVLADWIADGLAGPRENDRRIDHLEVLPKNAVLSPGAKQQLIVIAHFGDGHREDVTQWVKYTSANGEVAQVDEQGLVQITGYGEGALTAWYLSKVVVASVTVPFANTLEPAIFAQAPRRNFIDDLVLAKLQNLNLPPSPECTDAEFLRRAYLDTSGTLPTVAEVRAFLADTSENKRDKLIETLLARSEFVDYWTYKWSDLLLVNSERLPPPAMWAYYHWIRNQVAANTPWDELARRLLTSTGSTLENGATNFFVLHKDPQDLTETTSQAFLGMSVNCARCHNHPLEKWTNNQYYGMASLFSRVRSKDAEGPGNLIVYSATDGEVVQPVTGKPQAPRPLDADAISPEATADRRLHLARWLTSPENPYFSRAITNRVWANFLGVGVVESVDDLRLTNPASNEQLLDALAKHLVDNKFDLKALMRLIMQSKTYQRSSVPLPGNMGDRRFYSRYFPKRMMAEVALDAASQVTGVPTAFPNYPAGYRALQLPDSNVASYFLSAFGRPDRTVTCECERSDEPSVVQAMHLSNGDTINKKLQVKDNRLGKMLAEKTPDEKLIQEAFLAALARYPSGKERDELLAALKETPPAEKRAMLEDLYWGLLSSKEFLFNH